MSNGVPEYEAPAGPVEEVLALIWAEFLGVERVGRNDQFFELGGHSLLAIKILERMRGAGMRASIKAFFGDATLAGLAAAVEVESQRDRVPPNRIAPGCTRITPDLLSLVQLGQEEIDRVVATVAGGASNVQDIYPLAPLQEGILFHSLMSRCGDPYLISSLFRFTGREELDAYVAALSAVIARHDILRTAIVWDGLAQPVQVVWREAPPLLEEVTFDPARGSVEAQLREQFDPLHYRIDLRRAPLHRLVAAFDPETGRWVMVSLVHHLIEDNLSLQLARDEIEAHLAGRAAILPPSRPFRNFMAEVSAGLGADEHRRFFTEVLGDVTEPTAPFGLTEWNDDGSATTNCIRRVPPQLASRVYEAARAFGVSPACLFHVAWAQVLMRTTGTPDVTFGTVLLGRTRESTDRTLGLFINTLPVRLDLAGRSVRETVAAAQSYLAELLHHEHASLTLALRCSGLPPAVPLFTSILNYRQAPGLGRDDGGQGGAGFKWAGIEEVDGEERTTYPLGINIDDLADGFQVQVQARAPADADAVYAMVECALGKLVEALDTAPTKRIDRLDVLPAEERSRILGDWNRTEADFPEHLCFHEMVEAQARANPDSSAVVEGDRLLSYAALNAQANRLATHLRNLGVGPDTRVGICTERSLDMVVAVLAVMKAGGAYVPLDPAYPADRLAFIVADSDPIALIAHEATAAVVASLSCGEDRRPVVDLGACVWTGPPRRDVPPADIGLDSRNLAYVIYTSGSTGRPKGVLIEHRSLVNLAYAQRAEFATGLNRNVLQFASFSFDASVYEIVLALGAGGTLHLRPPAGVDSLASFAEFAAEHRITHATLPPAFLGTVEDPSALAGISTMVVAGEAVNPTLVERFAPGRSLYNGYGPTEATVCTTLHRFEPGVDPGLTPPIGRPIANMRVYILDERLEPVPQGVVGEIHIGGIGVARGYLNRPELTADRFKASPFVEGDRLYRTGDLGRHLPDGTIEFVGRNDLQVKIRGFRIEPGEIEARLLDHPGVREVVVFAQEDRPGDRRLVAYWTPAGERADVASLRAHLVGLLPEHMVPAAYVRLDALPLTPNGKVDRNALPAPEGTAFGDRSFAPPQNAVESGLADIWAELLGLERGGRDDHFFELGGHSLLAVRALSRIRERSGADVSLADLYDYPTPLALAARISVLGSADGVAAAADSPVIQLRASRGAPPVFLLPAMAGGLTYYDPLAEELSSSYAIYGLDAFDEGAKGAPTLEALAARYAQAIREVAGEAAPICVGYSFGGVLATEVARALAGSGPAPEALVLLDTIVPVDPRGWVPHGADVWTAFADYVSAILAGPGEMRDVGAGDFEGLAAALGGDRVSTALIEQMHQVFSANAERLRAYRPKPFGGRSILYRGLRSQHSATFDPSFLWLQSDVVDLNVDHQSILQPNIAEFIAQDMTQRLRGPERARAATAAEPGFSPA